MDGIAQGAGTFAVDDADALQMGDAGFVQILVEFPDGIIRSKPQEIELRGDGRAAGQIQALSGGRCPVCVAEGTFDGASGLFFACTDRIAIGIQGVSGGIFCNQAKVGEIDLALQNTASDIDLAVPVGTLPVTTTS